MSPPAFNDFGADCAGLFNDHHSQGSVSYAHKGKMSSGADYEINASNATGAKEIEWSFKTACHNMDITYNHENTISKSVNFNVKQVPGLAATYNCSFNAASGLDLGNIEFNYGNDKANVNVGANISASPKIDFNASVDTGFKNHVVGISSAFDASNGSMSPVAFGVNRVEGGTQCTWAADDIMNPLVGNLSMYVALPNNKNFCCYGVQMATGAEPKLSLAAASACCKNQMRYKIDHDGMFHVAKVSKLSKEMSLNLSTSLNLKNLSSGNHKFGAGLSWE